MALQPLADFDEGCRQIGERPVEIGGARLLDHLLERIQRLLSRDQAVPIAGDSRVLAEMPGESEHRLGGADGVVKAAIRNIAAEADLQSGDEDSQWRELG